MLHAAGKLQIAQEEEAQAIKLVKTLQSKLAATSAATAALAADQALLAASLDKLSAREKELLDSKGFMEGKRLINPGTANHKLHMQTTNANHKCKPQPQSLNPSQASALCASKKSRSWKTASKRSAPLPTTTSHSPKLALLSCKLQCRRVFCCNSLLIAFTFLLQRLGQKRAEIHAQEQQLGRERGSLTQQFEAESNALYEATKHVSLLLDAAAAAAAA